MFMNIRHVLITFLLLLAAAMPLRAAETPLAADTSTALQPAFRRALIDLASIGEAPLDTSALGKFKALLRQYGWPTVVAAGRDGVDAAGKLLLRSSADYDFQRACTHVLPSRIGIDVSARAAAMIYDRVQMAHGEPQQMDTLFMVDHGKVVLAAPNASPAEANAMRDSIGLPTVAQDMQRLHKALRRGQTARTILAIPRLARATQTIRFPALQRRLKEMADKDQAVRHAVIQSGMKADSPQQRAENDVDASNLKRLKAIFAKHGFPDRSMVGRSGVESAWLLVQHATSDTAFMAKALQQARPLMIKGDLSRDNYALLVDRVRLQQGKQQLYGSQFHGKPGHFYAYNLKDPSHVDRRRAELGLQPLANYLKFADALYMPEPSGAASSATPAHAASSISH